MRVKLEQLKHTNIDHKVYEIITEKILSGVLAPGVRLTEEELATELGVSRTPVREAVKRLAQDELVELLPRRGMYVKKLSREDIAEIYEVRMGLEGLAISLAVKLIPDKELGKLSDELEFAKRELEAGRVDAWLAFDTDFHSLVVEHCGNRRLRTMLERLNNLVGYFRIHVARKSERAKQALEEHSRILAALKTRDQGQAEAAMRAHVQSARENILKDIEFQD